MTRILVFILGAVSLLCGPVHAHLPHDVIIKVVVSPDFTADGTALIIAQLTDHRVLQRTTDGGLTWTAYGAPMLNLGVKAMVFSPDFAADATVFAGTQQGGVWRSTDGGITWAPANAGLVSTAVFDLAVSPAFAIDGRLLAATASGVFRSDDGGDTWSAASTGLAEAVVLGLAFAPDDASTAFAGGTTLHRSDDGGASWTPRATLPHPLETLSVSPAYSVDQTLAAGFGRLGAGVLVSTDGGDTLTSASVGLEDMAVNEVLITVGGATFAVAKLGGCHRADTPGAPWTSFTAGFADPSAQTSNHYLSVAASPTVAADGVVFVAAFEGLFRSDDGGQLFRELDTYGLGLLRRVALTPTFAEDGLLFALSYGGGPWCYRYTPDTNPLPSKSGHPTPGGHGPVAAAGSLSPALPRDPVTLAPGTAGPWIAHGSSLPDLYPGEVVVSPGYADDRTVFYGFLNLWRSTDAGASWTAVGSPVPFIRTLELSPDFVQDQTLFVGSTEMGNWISEDAGGSWRELTGGFPPDAKVMAAAFSPDYASDRTVFAGSSNHGLWRSTDGGFQWTDVTPDPAAIKMRTVAVSPDIARDGLVLAGTIAGGLFRSTDGGNSWLPADAGLPAGPLGTIEHVAFSPDFAADQTVYVASATDGLYRSTDGGLSWQPAENGLPLDVPRHVAISPAFQDDDTLFVGTHSGAWVSTDRGDVWAPLPGFVRADDTHPTVIHVGSWATVGQPGAHGGSVHRASRAGAATELTFHGRTIRWHGVRNLDSGRADVRLDGSLVTTVDLYAETAGSPETVFVHDFGSAGWHTIEIVVTGTARAAATGTVVRSDGFEYTF